MAHESGRLAQEWQPLPDDRRELDAPLAGHGAESNGPVILADVGEACDRVQVDQRRRPRQPEVHERHEALTAGQQLRLAAIACEHRDRLFERSWRVILELDGFHGCEAPSGCRARWIISQSRVGDMGSSVILTPSGASASLTALAITAGTVMELDSPSPLDPSGVSGEGETTWAMSITGASEAVGTR